jgi:hypothetical protein
MYGQGHYGAGIYGGIPAPDPPPPPAQDNPTYGSGTYGYGIYSGDPIPTFPAATTRPALHILAIGPASPHTDWRGAENYNLPAGARTSRPHLALPAAQSKSFTLRLNEGSEARTEHQLTRGAAIIIDEMDTDLWWRRRDPRSRRTEMIGRFNASHVNLAASDTGVNLSVQWDDYQTILGARMVMRMLHPDWNPPKSMWDAGTPVTDVLRWAIPANTGLDLTELDTFPLGAITQPFHLPPDTEIADVFDQLEAISPLNWEWWIETPANLDRPPILRFAIGRRGQDKQVVLFDLGKGPSPIQSWTRQAAEGNYANCLYFTGKSGGAIVRIPAEINRYGQRDAKDGNSGVADNAEVLRAAAMKRLTRWATRRPTYTLTLTPGYWRGRTHIDIGDTVRLILALGAERIDTRYRISELSCEIDANGHEEVTLTLGTPLPSADPRSKRAPLMRLIRYIKNYETPRDAPTIDTDDNDLFEFGT